MIESNFSIISFKLLPLIDGKCNSFIKLSSYSLSSLLNNTGFPPHSIDSIQALSEPDKRYLTFCIE